MNLILPSSASIMRSTPPPRLLPRLSAMHLLAALVSIVCAVATPPLPRDGQLRVAVSELFRDIFSDKRACVPDVGRAPWLTWPELAGTWHSPTSKATPSTAGDASSIGTLLPTMHALNATILSAAHLYDPRRRRCSGDARVVSAEAAPPGFCVNGMFPEQPGAAGHRFEQYESERHVLSRWLQRTDLVCGAGAQSVSAMRRQASAEGPKWCDADVVLVPSLALHYHSMANAQHFNGWNRCLVRSLFERYWLGIHDLYYRQQRGPGLHRLVAVVAPHSWQSQAQLHNLRTMAVLPDRMRARLVVGTALSSMANADSAILDPHSRYGWRDNAEEELARRESLLRDAAMHGGEKLVAFGGGPLFVTLPYTVGVAHPVDWTTRQGSFDPVQGSHMRRPIALLYDANAKCSGKGRFLNKQRVRPLLEAALRRSKVMAACNRSADTHASALAVCARAGSNDCCSFRAPMYEALARSTFAIEPPGDTPERSHAYAAAVAGALPVLIEGGHRSYNQSRPTAWAWRAAEGALHKSTANQVKQTNAPTTVSLDYSRFSVLLSAAEVEADESGTWVHALLKLSKDSAKLASMQAELQRAMPFFTYLPHDCPAGAEHHALAGSSHLPVCDAVSAFDAVVARAWAASSQLA